VAIKLSSAVINPWQELQDFQNTALQTAAQFGATSIFIGTMRDYNQGDQVIAMSLDYYPGMTEKQLAKIVAEAEQRWQILDSLVVHRVGEIRPDETIVVVAIWASHRGDAFDACRFIMETLKSNAPFWKKEILHSGQERWVEKNTDGYQTK
jgi:molybdopterin synthase catalytic subunit